MVERGNSDAVRIRWTTGDKPIRKKLNGSAMERAATYVTQLTGTVQSS